MHLIVSSAKSRVHVTSERPMEEPVSGLLRLSIAVGALFFCALNDVHVDGLVSLLVLQILGKQQLLVHILRSPHWTHAAQPITTYRERDSRNGGRCDLSRHIVGEGGHPHHAAAASAS
jgi:hypothetical protein